MQLRFPFFPGNSDTRVRTPSRPAQLRSLHVGTRRIEYTLKRSKRRSIGFVVGTEGLVVTAPFRASLAQVESTVRAKERWIVAKTTELGDHQRRVCSVDWSDGGKVPYLGQQVLLRLTYAGSARRAKGSCNPGSCNTHFDPHTTTLHVCLQISASAEELKDVVQSWLHSEARRIFAERLAQYAIRLGVSFERFRLSSASTRWGSCSARGKILLNWRLIHFPLSSIDYVVAHELAHLKQMNHGPEFWRHVGSLMPDFERERAFLKRPPPELLPKL